MICIFFALKVKTRKIADELGITATESSADNREESGEGESTNLTIDVTGNSFPMQDNEKEEIYYDSMQEALLNSTIALDLEEQYRKNIDEVIKVFENEKVFRGRIKWKKEKRT